MKVLIPVDFGHASRIAAQYALVLEGALNMDILLVHMIKPYSRLVPGYGEALAQDERIAYDELEKFRDWMMTFAHRGMNVTARVITGEHLHNVLPGIVKEEKIDLILIGTEGANWLRRYLGGTHAASVANTSECPVITVPAKAAIRKIRNIVYATDLLYIEQEMKDLIAFARVLDAWVHVLHVFSRKEYMQSFNSTEWINRARYNFDYMKITFCGSADNDVVEGIESCIGKENADLLAIFSNHKNYAERMIMDSVSLEETMKAEVPVLTFYKRH